MAHIQHTISLHNLSVAADPHRNVPPIVRCLVDPSSSLEQLSEPGHRWKIVFHPNSLWNSQTRENPTASGRDCTVDAARPSTKNCEANLVLYVPCEVFALSFKRTMPLVNFPCFLFFTTLCKHLNVSHYIRTRNVLLRVLQRWSQFPIDAPFLSRTAHQRLSLSEWNCWRWKTWN